MRLRLTGIDNNNNNNYISFTNPEGSIGFYKGIVKDYIVKGRVSIGYAILYTNDSKRFSI